MKNDHLGFEVLYLYRGVVRKYRPDFLVWLANGDMLVLETKGQDTEQDQVKRRYLDEWTQAVNAHGVFDRWRWAVAANPGAIRDILLRHAGATQLPEEFLDDGRNSTRSSSRTESAEGEEGDAD